MWGTVAVVLAVSLDWLVAEPPARIHPVALLGRIITPLDREWPSPTVVGACIAAIVPLGGALVVAGTTHLAGSLATPAQAVVAGLWLFSLSSLRMLVDLTSEVVAAADTDLDEARSLVRGLVGRDTTALDAPEIRSAAVESLAENLADGLVAPLTAFVLGAQVSLTFAVGAVGWIKGVNTLDSMLGYPEKRHGTASARLDDGVMWLPSRLSAVLIALVARDSGAVRRASEWASAPPSPNSGWPMATLAVVLDVRLRKSGVYDLNPTAPLPTAEAARRGVHVVTVAGGLTALSAGVLSW